ncbi:M1 family metallopeptidase [Saccharomonospora sp. NB11]|jgi:aminopeptidase N|uniref:M1 family metallopeptidase n=1 Tax=Saccharomonospora sp. NB11 TaxID=1642298 RepID=UPI0018D009AF|nr:M1 family metallopeptidase [Saccharomonospora sp. NB11]
MRNQSRVYAVGVASSLVAVLVTTSASAAPGPGAPGVGDPYYPGDGNGGYDVTHYDIRLTYEPETDFLSGTTTILATTTSELSSFNLDFALDVESVRVNNSPARVDRDPDDPTEVVVTPATELGEGEPMTVVVRYADTPSEVEVDGFTAWKRTETGALAVDQPHIAEWWFPSNDHPTDKATYDVSVAVPDDVAALSNGVLTGRSKVREGWTRWNWRSTEPQATYLTFLAVGDYEVRSSTTPSGLPIVNAYEAGLGELRPAAEASIERTPEVVEFLELIFGPYPFEAQGGVVTSGLGFALETQTRSVYDAGFFRQGTNMSVVVHENAHQWFGDAVSLGSWADIWLNEGFASYAEFLWSEYNGEGTAAELAQYLYDSIPADDPFWQVLPGDPGAENQFDAAVYDRGALAAHALRTAVGDETFVEILRTWLDTYRGGDATLADFVALAEEVSGTELDELFDTWLFTKGKPEIGPNGAEVRTTAVTEPESFREIAFTHEQLAKHH